MKTLKLLALAFWLGFSGRARATVTNLTTAVSYTCDGIAQTAFGVSFPYSAASDLVVTTGASYGTTLALTTDYTLSVTSTQTTATLNLVAAAKCTTNIKISRVTPLTQPTSLRTQGAYNPATIEAMFDRAERQTQEVNAKLGAAAATTAGGDLSGTFPNPTVTGVTCTPTGACTIDSGQTSGTVSIGGASGTGTITIGKSTAGQEIDIGHAIVATGNVQTIAIGDNAAGTGYDNITIGNINGASSTILRCGTGTCEWSGAPTATLVLGDGVTSGTVSVGASLTSGTLNLGTSALYAGAVNIATAALLGTVTIGGTGETGTLTLGQSTAGQEIDIGHATVATGNTQTIKIGDAAAGTGLDVITVGNTNGASSLALKAGTAGVALSSTGATTILAGSGGAASAAEIGTGGAAPLYFKAGGFDWVSVNPTGTMTFTGITFASLGTPSNGTIVYCSDCQIANPCTNLGSGAFAKRLNGAWVCN